MNKIIVLVIIFSSFYSQAFTQSTLKGVIREFKTGDAIPYASVSIGYENGTASNENGEFALTLNPGEDKSRLQISCIGYHSKGFSIDSLLRVRDAQLVIYLTPFVTMLNEVMVSGKKISPEEIVKEAISKIPTNYIQQPFNMKFYSRIAVNDSAITKYLVETFVETYREGYKESAQNHSRIVERRTTGVNPFPTYDKKRKVEYFAYETLPGFDVFLVDMLGSGTKFSYTIFNPDYFKRLEFRQKDISIFDSDTVFVIEYDQKNFKTGDGNSLYGKLFISTRNMAILKHERRIGKNSLEVIYKQNNDLYFPYFIKTIYPTKVGSEYKLKVVHEAFIKSIVTKDVVKIESQPVANKNWHLEDVPYNKSFWDNFQVPGK